MYFLFSFLRTQPCIESWHPRTLYPDDVIRETIGPVGSTIYVVNKVLFICHSLLTLRIYAIYKIGNTYIRCMLFSFLRTQPGFDPGFPRSLYPDDVILDTIGHMGHPIYVVNEVLFIHIIYKIFYTDIIFFFRCPTLVMNRAILVLCIQTISSLTPSVTWVPQYML